MDDTRDIAIRAEETSKSAHKRLDGINGQIGKLANSHDQMLQDFNHAIYGSDGNDLDGGLVGAFLELKSTVTHALKIAGVVATAAIAIVSALVAWDIEQHHSGSHSQPSRKSAAPHAHRAAAQRQRGSSVATRHVNASPRTTRRKAAHPPSTLPAIGPAPVPIPKLERTIHKIVRDVSQVIPPLSSPASVVVGALGH